MGIPVNCIWPPIRRVRAGAYMAAGLVVKNKSVETTTCKSSLVPGSFGVGRARVVDRPVEENARRKRQNAEEEKKDKKTNEENAQEKTKNKAAGCGRDRDLLLVVEVL